MICHTYFWAMAYFSIALVTMCPSPKVADDLNLPAQMKSDASASSVTISWDHLPVATGSSLDTLTPLAKCLSMSAQ